MQYLRCVLCHPLFALPTSLLSQVLDIANIYSFSLREPTWLASHCLSKNPSGRERKQVLNREIVVLVLNNPETHLLVGYPEMEGLSPLRIGLKGGEGVSPVKGDEAKLSLHLIRVCVYVCLILAFREPGIVPEAKTIIMAWPGASRKDRV